MNALPAPVAVAQTRQEELIQLVSFNLSGEEYGVEVLSVREIIRMSTITKMPNTPYFVEGIINLRGKVIPIIDLRKRFGLEEQEPDSKTRIMVMDDGKGLTGLVVDSVSEVIRIHGSEIQPPPPLISENISQEFIAGVFNHADRLLIVMNSHRMFNEDEQGYLASC